jgi:hypothetical protein
MFLALATTLGCGSDNSEEPGASCNTDVTSVDSPAAGYATLHGSFFSNETVIIQETDGTVISQGTPDSDRNAFTLGGVPSGTHTYEIVISCDAGRDNLGSFTFNVD